MFEIPVGTTLDTSSAVRFVTNAIPKAVSTPSATPTTPAAVPTKTFTPDPNLFRSFYGICYQPANLLPDCKTSQDQVCDPQVQLIPFADIRTGRYRFGSALTAYDARETVQLSVRSRPNGHQLHRIVWPVSLPFVEI